MQTRLTLLTIALGALVGCDLGTSSGTPTDSGTSATTTQTNITPNADPLGMVAAHNRVRGQALPTPEPPLPDVSWDADLAVVAQAWADRCDFNHSDNQYGENLSVTTWESQAGEIVDSWFSEIEDYDYASNTCSGVCGHYTQLVWRDSINIGCAYADCDVLTGVESFNQGRLWVCNYDPPGNWVGEWPY